MPLTKMDGGVINLMIKIKCDKLHQDLLTAKYGRQHTVNKTAEGLEIASAMPLQSAMLRTELAANKFITLVNDQLLTEDVGTTYNFRSPIVFRSDDTNRIEEAVGEIAELVAKRQIDPEINDPKEIRKEVEASADRVYKALLGKAEMWSESYIVDDFTWLLDEHECGELEDQDLRELRRMLEPSGRRPSASKIASMLMKDGNESELEQYVDKDLKDLVTSIRFRVKPAQYSEGFDLLTDVVCTQSLDAGQITKLEKYLTGQFSDGWGEGLEQSPLDETNVLAKVWWSANDRKYVNATKAWKLTQEK